MIRVDHQTFIDLGKTLKGYEDGAAMKRALAKHVRAAAAPVIDEQRRNVRALSGAPTEWRKSAARRTRAKLELKVKKRAGVRIITSKQKGSGPFARYMNRGRWRHPVYGNYNKWVTQTVLPFWFDYPAKKARGPMQSAVVKAVNETLHEIARKASK